MEEAVENGKKSLHFAHANGMNECLHIYKVSMLSQHQRCQPSPQNVYIISWNKWHPNGRKPQQVK
jgi:hypothetical protein